MYKTRLQNVFFARRKCFALATEIFLLLIFGAMTASSQVENRWLFIFDTSSGMKPCVPAVQFEINSLLSTSMSSQLRIDDTIGIWTFDQKLHTGGFPLARWDPNEASMLASNMNKFVQDQHYANTPHLDVIASAVAQVVKNSPRLTVLIFCSGENQLNWTPYSNGVNQVFLKWKSSQKKAKQPFVVVLRSQLGEYIGCTMNFPPGAVNLLQFPPMPPRPAPTNTTPLLSQQTNKPPPVRMAAPLIIVGTHVGTNEPPPKSVTTNSAPPPTSAAPMVETNVSLPMPARTVELTNPVAPAGTTPPAQAAPPFVPGTNVEIETSPQLKPQAANPVVATPINVTPPPQTNPVATVQPATPEILVSSATGGLNRTTALVIGVTALIVAVVIAVVFIFRARHRDRGSLISHSMRKP